MAPGDVAGRTIECPRCERTVPVPGWIATGGDCAPAFAPEILSIEIKFLCGGCDRALLADIRWGGKTFACPKCGAPARVPEWWGAKAPAASAKVPPPRFQSAALSAAEIDFLNGGNNDDGGTHATLMAPG